MRIAGASLLIPLLFSVACNDSFPVPPDVPATHTTVTIAATKNPAALAVFRDGFGAAWTPAATAHGGFTADVTGPYEVAVVCQIPGTTPTWLTWEHADSPNPKVPGSTALTPPCDRPATHTVTGTVTGAFAAARTVSPGGGLEAAVTAGAFTIPNVPGSADGKTTTYDLVFRNATTAGIG